MCERMDYWMLCMNNVNVHVFISLSLSSFPSSSFSSASAPPLPLTTSCILGHFGPVYLLHYVCSSFLQTNVRRLPLSSLPLHSFVVRRVVDEHALEEIYCLIPSLSGVETKGKQWRSGVGADGKQRSTWGDEEGWEGRRNLTRGWWQRMGWNRRLYKSTRQEWSETGNMWTDYRITALGYYFKAVSEFGLTQIFR